MRISNIKNPADEAFKKELENGGRFVVFEYCISIIIFTFRRTSEVYFVRRDESTFKYSWQFTLITLTLGWWGIPWGPIYSIASLFNNASGGKNITVEILKSFGRKKTVMAA